MSSSVCGIILVSVVCMIGSAFGQFSGGFPFSLVPGLRIPFIGGNTGIGGGYGGLGQGLGFGGQQQGWNAKPIATAAPVQQSGWGSQPVVAMVAPVVQPTGWGSRPATVFQAPIQHSGWGSQPLALQAPIIQPSGWGSHNAAQQVLPSSERILPANQEGNKINFDFKVNKVNPK